MPTAGWSMSGASSAEVPAAPVTLVVGLGNPLLCDDGVGWLVVDAVEAALGAGGGVAFDRLAVGGLSLMERLVGADRAILVDAVVTGEDPAGTVRLLDAGELPAREASHLDSAHDVTLAAALAAGHAMGARLPSELAIVTVEAAAVSEFGEQLTPAVEAAIPVAAGAVVALLRGR